MITKIVEFSLNNKFIILLGVIALIVAGIFAMRTLPIDAVPDITNNQVQVVTISPSLVPQEMEQFITYPVEMSVANIPNVVEVRSISRFGLSVVTIVFEDNVPILEARQYVKEQLAHADANIPDELGSPEMMPITTGLGEVYQYTLNVDPAYRGKYDPMALRTIQDWIIKRQLNGIKGIIEISSFGGFVKQYEVAVDPKRLSEVQVTITDVFDALRKNNQNSGGSYIEQGPNIFYIRTEGIVKDYNDIENIVVRQKDGVPVLVKHIAEVRLGHPPRFGAMTMDGKGETVGGITLMFKGGNSSEAIENVHQRIAQVQKSLPEGVSIEPYLDRSVLVNKTINTVRNNLVEGGLIVIFVLILLLGNLRAGFIVASVIPLSLLFAFIMMRLIGVSANLMSLGAIDFGIVIDGAVIIVEAVLHFLTLNFIGQRLSQGEMDNAIKNAATKTIASAAFGVFIILIVFVPVMTLTGIEGKMFTPMAQTVSFAILGALILSLTYVPVAASIFLRKEIKDSPTIANSIVGALKVLYEPSLKLALRIPYWTIASTIAVFLATAFLFSRMGAEFIPTLEEGDLAMQMTLRPGSSLEASVRSSTQAEKILIENFPEVEHVVSKIGTAEVPTDPMAVEEADIMIILKPKQAWVSANDREELVEMMKNKLGIIKAASFEFTQPIQLRFNELMTGSKADVAVKIFGEDLEKLHALGVEAAAIISQIEGAGDVKVEQTDGLPQMMISYNREKIALHGVDITALNRVIRTAFAGEVAGVVYEGERRFDLVIRQARRDDLKLSRLFILNYRGQMVPVSELARLEVKNGPMQIAREDAHRRISIGINIRNRDVASLIAEVQEQLDAKLIMPPGYYIRYGGQFENLEAAKSRLKIAVPIALALIFILLYFAFDSIKYAIMILTTVPMSAIGGVIALYIRDMPFSISAGIGFIALFGVAVLNGIVLISYFNLLRQENVTMPIKEVVLQGGLARLRPVIMTAAVASLGFLPMALSTTAGAEVQKPLATVVIGGLISSTLLTLILLPIIYKLIESGVMRKVVGVIAIPVLLFVAGQADGQHLTLPAAIDSTLANNQEMLNAELSIEQAQSQRKGSLRLGATTLDFTYGQMNTSANDVLFEVTQQLGNLAEQSRYAKAFKTKVAYEVAIRDQIRQRLTRDVKLAWEDLVYRQALLHHFRRQIDIITEYRRRVDSRLAAGEISVVEHGLVIMEQSDLYRQLALAELDFADELERFREITKIGLIDIAADSLTLLPYDFNRLKRPMDTTLLRPYEYNLQYFEDQVRIRSSGYFPDISIGYFNQSLDGLQGFQGVRAGVSIPLWFKPTRQGVKQAKIDFMAAQNIYRSEVQRFNFNYEKAIQKLARIYTIYESSRTIWDYDINELIVAVEKELLLGEVDYVTYAQVSDRIRSSVINRLDLINKINKAIIEVEYYSNE